MKKLILSIICCTLLTSVFGQDGKEYFDKGISAINDRKLDEAISYFDKSIAAKNDEFIVWYNRGIVKSWQRRLEESIVDFNQAIILNPQFKKSYNSRGNSRQDLTDYQGALADYNMAVSLDSKYIDAIYNRGELYELLGNKDKACEDFNLALNLGDSISQRKVDRCNDTTKSKIVIHSILRLTKSADNKKYGFTSENPIMVGTGPNGGPANQRAYLNLLRDPQGKPVKYERLSSCSITNRTTAYLVWHFLTNMK